MRLAISPAVKHSALALAAAALGLAVSNAAGLGDVGELPAFRHAVVVLLVVGLLGSTFGIQGAEVRSNARIVALAVTVGVFAKAGLVAIIMVLAFHNPIFLLLGIAVAQIDPLSVATMVKRSRMSRRARTILMTWASFDDPVTVLLTIYAAALVAQQLGGSPATASGSGVASFAGDLAANLGLAAVSWLLWRIVEKAPEWLRIAALLAVTAVAAWFGLVLAIALVGLFFRPAIAAVLDRCVQAAYVVAAFAIGLVLVHGVDIVAGAALGCAVFGAHIAVSTVLTRGLPRTDRIYLALGQQNGITAIILALSLEPDFPGAVGIVAPAIVVVNVANVVANAYWDRRTVAPAPIALAEKANL